MAGSQNAAGSASYDRCHHLLQYCSSSGHAELRTLSTLETTYDYLHLHHGNQSQHQCKCFVGYIPAAAAAAAAAAGKRQMLQLLAVLVTLILHDSSPLLLEIKKT